MVSRRRQQEDVHKRYAKEAVAQVLKDPLFNPDLTYPESPCFTSRLLENPILQGYYRPDLFKAYRYKRPSTGEVAQAVQECKAGLSPDVLWRTAYGEGVFYRFKEADVLADHLCIALFSRLTKADAASMIQSAMTRTEVQE